MIYLLDTCYLSEFAKSAPNSRVVDWGKQVPLSQLCLSSLTIGELDKGIHGLPPTQRRRYLAKWLQDELLCRFAGRILPVDEAVARRWGQLQAIARSKGAPLPVIDSLIAATALVHGLQVVTRNVADLERCGVDVVNPWEGA